MVTAERLTDERVRAPSRLPGWSVGHVLAHLARNAEGYARRLEGALEGEDRLAGQPARRWHRLAAGPRRQPVDRCPRPGLVGRGSP
ncbi:MAG: maleylpyruvate isomerase N-terminal domain-containing protein [Acidimicrobiales bacterium]